MRDAVSGSLKALLVAAVLMGSTTGCKRLIAKLKKMDAGAESATASAEGSPQDDADEQLQEKLDEYIKCLNALSSPIHQSRHRYFTYIPRTGPTGRETYADLFSLPAGATANCAAGIERSRTMPPSDPALESSGKEFADAASAIDRIVTEADKYYENKDFRDDRWAKGKQLHPRLLAAFDRFSKADKGLHDTLDAITKPLAQRVLGRIEREEGKKYRYYRKAVLIGARELVETSDPIGDDDDVDFTRYGAAYTAFEKVFDDLQAYGTTHRSELTNQKLAPSWPMAESNYDTFVSEAGDFKKAAKEFWRCLRDAPAKAKTPSGKVDLDKMGNCADGPAWKQGENVLKQYNEFIRASNTRPFP